MKAKGEMHVGTRYTAIIERDGDWYIGYALEFPAANGQGCTISECRTNLAQAVELVLEYEAECRRPPSE